MVQAQKLCTMDTSSKLTSSIPEPISIYQVRPHKKSIHSKLLFLECLVCNSDIFKISSERVQRKLHVRLSRGYIYILSYEFMLGNFKKSVKNGSITICRNWVNLSFKHYGTDLYWEKFILPTAWFLSFVILVISTVCCSKLGWHSWQWDRIAWFLGGSGPDPLWWHGLQIPRPPRAPPGLLPVDLQCHHDLHTSSLLSTARSVSWSA